jgi:hypothetical protein
VCPDTDRVGFESETAVHLGWVRWIWICVSVSVGLGPRCPGWVGWSLSNLDPLG